MTESLRIKLEAVGITKHPKDMTPAERDQAQDLLLTAAEQLVRVAKQVKKPDLLDVHVTVIGAKRAKTGTLSVLVPSPQLQGKHHGHHKDGSRRYGPTRNDKQ